MEPDFWHKRWSSNDIGFHEANGNHLLKTYFDDFALPDASVIFVPLCGKTRDIAWLLSHNYKVVGVELNEQAVQQLFAELGAMPQIQKLDHFTRYYAAGLNVYVGDFFELDQSHTGKIDLVYDRAALVALPNTLRKKYSEHLQTLSPSTPQLLICYQYEQSLFKGPPFSICAAMVDSLYAQGYRIDCLYHGQVEGGFRGQSEVFEAVYKLKALTK